MATGRQSARKRGLRFQGRKHLARWLRTHRLGRQILEELIAEEIERQRPVLITIQTCGPPEFRGHAVLRCYGYPSVDAQVIQGPHTTSIESEPLVRDYLECKAMQLRRSARVFHPRYLLVEKVIRRVTAEELLAAQWKLDFLETCEQVGETFK